MTGGFGSEQEMRFNGALSSDWWMEDPAPACERRSHRQTLMRLRRPSTNGTTELSSIRPAEVSRIEVTTTSRGLPAALRQGNGFVEGCSFQVRDLDATAPRLRERHLRNDGSNCRSPRRTGTGPRRPDDVSIRQLKGRCIRNSRNWVERMMVCSWPIYGQLCAEYT
jgi:hypothetical protein